MERVIKLGKTVRNNWKKSVFGVIALYYGGAKVKEKYEINVLMRAACKEAAKYGDSLIPMDRNPTLITVILNPVANKRSAKKDFEKYCEPLLHLAGLQLDVIQTTSEGNAKEIVETLRGTEAIIVAGGDGTLSETVTGLLRRNDGANQFPIGILPLGRTNTLGNTMFPGGNGVKKVKQLIEASMAIIEGNTLWKDAMKIEPIVEEAEIPETPSRPIYAMSSIEWGAFRDVRARRDKYWMYGPLREYVSYIFNGYKDALTWNCSGTIRYTQPCAGCSNCLQIQQETKKRWMFFLPNHSTGSMQHNQAKITNPECSVVQELCFKTCNFDIRSPNIEKLTPVPALNIIIGKNRYSYTEFVYAGWNRLKGKDENAGTTVIPARTVELLPKKVEEDVNIEIDKEEFEVKPVKITLLPKVIKLFCKPDVNEIRI